jgi:isopentenyldiphosphate isomerase
MSENHFDEIFPVVDKKGNKISVALRTVCHNGKSKLLHPVVHLHLINNAGEIFLQKRAVTKDILAGKWDTSAGGHISPDESVEDALRREVFEEIGLKNFKFQLIKKYIWESDREREYVYSFIGCSEETPATNPEEVEEGRFWTVKEIKENFGKDIFTPNFEYEFMNIIPRSLKER